MDMEDKHYGRDFFLWWMSVEALGGFVYCSREFVVSGWSDYGALAGAGIAGTLALVTILLQCGCRVPLVSRLGESFLAKDLEDKFVRKGALWFAFFALAGLFVVVPLVICTSLAGDYIARGVFVRSLPYVTGGLMAVLVISVVLGIVVRPIRKHDE